MNNKVNSTVKAGAALGSGLEFFTLTATGVDLTANQPVLNAVIETISTKAQPVILEITNATTLKFAVEHPAVVADDTADVSKAISTAVAAAILAVTTAAGTPVTSTVALTKMGL